MKKELAIKNRFFGSGGAVSGIFGGIGSLHNFCHSLCMAVVSILATFGITMSILPLMFLQTYQLYFWLMGFAFTVASLYFYLQQDSKLARDKNMLFINSGLLIFGLPISQLADYMDFFRFIGISLTTTGIFLIFFANRFKYLIYDESELRQETQDNLVYPSAKIQTTLPITSIIRFPKLKLSAKAALYVIILPAFLINQYYIFRMGILGNMKAGSSVTSTVASPMNSLSKMKLTPFDIVLAKERMDKNNDGICDTCGMSIQQCIDSGQMECNMGSNSQAIGVLGSQHIHADWKIYINGKALDSNFFDPLAMDMSNPNKPTTSSFLHVDKGAPAPEKVGDIIHMHAKNVPLWVFFRSVGMNLTKDSLTLVDGKILKNENGNSIKFYLNGKKVDELGEYSYQPLDKLLISYGPVNDPEIQKQISSITNFAKDHR